MISTNLFGEIEVETPATEGIKYTGSKLKLLPYLTKLVAKYPVQSVFDGFCGTTRVSQAFAKLGYRVIANDISQWSKTFATCYLLNKYPKKHYKEWIDHLNNLPGKDGWFTEHYGGSPDNKISSIEDGFKKPWQIHNTRKLDAIREEIDTLNVSEAERAVLITSLIYALDEVDSTLGHFASYLSEWSPRSFKTMKLHVPEIFTGLEEHEVKQGEILDVLPEVEADLAYYDPPYGSNNEKMPPSRVRYASYYHVWTSVCLNDKPPIFGKAKRRADSADAIAGSIFEEFRKNPEGKFMALDAIEQLIKGTQAKFVLLSYSSGGRATKANLMEALEASGKILEFVSVNYRKNVMANMRWTKEWLTNDDTEETQEYMFLLEK